MTTTLCDVFSSLGFTSCRLHRLESRLARYAETGEGAFPDEIKHMEYTSSELTLRTGYFDHFSVEIEGMDGEQGISLPSDAVKKLLERDLPGFAKEALENCRTVHRNAGSLEPLRPAA